MRARTAFFMACAGPNTPHQSGLIMNLHVVEGQQLRLAQHFESEERI